MALLFFDGLNIYSNPADFASAKISENIGTQGYSNTQVFSTSYSRFGSPNRGLMHNDYNETTYWDLDSSLSPQTVTFGIVFYKATDNTPSLSTSYPLAYLSDGANAHIRICVDADYNIKVYRDTTLLGTSSGKQIKNNAWQILEGKIHIDDAAGTVQLKLDGVEIINLTGQDTQNGTNAYVRRFAVKCVHNEQTTYFDLVYFGDTTGDAPQNDVLGDCKVERLIPNGAGDQTDFTPSAGSNYENVDDTCPDDDGTYNSSDNIGDQDSYALPALPGSETIFGSTSRVTVAKSDAGVKGCKILTRSGGTFYKSDEILPSTTYEIFGKLYQNNPDDSAAWEKADVDAMELGVEVSS